MVHPVEKQPVRKNKVTEYGGYERVSCFYYKCVDDCKDEKKLSDWHTADFLKNKDKKAEAPSGRKDSSHYKTSE